MRRELEEDEEEMEEEEEEVAMHIGRGGCCGGAMGRRLQQCGIDKASAGRRQRRESHNYHKVKMYQMVG